LFALTTVEMSGIQQAPAVAVTGFRGLVQSTLGAIARRGLVMPCGAFVLGVRCWLVEFVVSRVGGFGGRVGVPRERRVNCVNARGRVLEGREGLVRSTRVARGRWMAIVPQNRGDGR
jgi:hypothetical protein